MKKILAGIMMAVVMLGVMTPKALAYTCDSGSLRANETVKTPAECNIPKEEGASLWDTVNTILNVVIGVLGMVTVAMIVLGGVYYVTSMGDSGKVKKAKDTIMYGVIGLVVALLAFAIVNFVLSSVFSK